MTEQSREQGKLVRSLLRAAETASLATALARDGSGHPYVSLVVPAATLAGEPLLLLSDLADHSRNLAADARASLLVGVEGRGEAVLAAARGTLLGRLERHEDPVDRQRYLARHSSAAAYAGFGDFHLYRLVPERAHLVAGFGRIAWIEAADLLLDPSACRELIAAESDIVSHMNADHSDALQAIAAGLLGRPEGAWTMTGIDPEGLDLRCGAAAARLDFPEMVTDPAGCRRLLVRLTREARARLEREQQA